MQQPSIFVISLKNSPRRALIEKRLTDLKLDFEFVDAIDGRTLSEQQLKQIDFQFYPDFCNKKLTIGEIGCALSHIKTYHVIQERREEKRREERRK